MVRFQRFTGCRPNEVCIIRPCDVDRKVPDDERYGVESTDKSYKYYIQQPGVRNAGA